MATAVADKSDSACAPKWKAASEGAFDAYRSLAEKAGGLFPLSALNKKRELKGHFRKVMALGWKATEGPPQLAACDQNNKIILWDVKSTMKKQIFDLPFAMCVDVHPTKDLIVAGSMSNVCAIVDMDPNQPEGKMIRSLPGASAPDGTGHDGYVGSVKFVEGGSKVLSAGGDGEVKLWDPEKGLPIGTFYGHDIDCGSISFPSGVPGGGNVFATGSSDKTVKLWDMRLAGKPNGCIMTFAAEGEVNCVDMFPDGNGVVAGCETCERNRLAGKPPEDWEKTTGAATFFDVRSGAEISKYTRRKSKCTNIQWSKSGRILFVSYEDGNVGMWDPWTEGGIKFKIPAHVDAPPGAAKNTSTVVSCMQLSPTGEVLATAGFDGMIKIWGPGNE